MFVPLSCPVTDAVFYRWVQVLVIAELLLFYYYSFYFIWLLTLTQKNCPSASLAKLRSLDLLLFNPSESYFRLQHSLCTKPATLTSLLMQTLQRKDDSLCFESPSEELVLFLPTGESPGCSNCLLKICLVTILHSFPKWQYLKLGECLKSRRFNKFSSCLQAPSFQMLLWKLFYQMKAQELT